MTPTNPPKWPRSTGERDRRVALALSRWFSLNARAFPWRPEGRRRDPYVSLVSEIMLQQTQASRVADRLPPFLARFPTVRELASASEDDVLAAWSGLGYYRRARGLHECAQAIVRRHGGRVPSDVEDLRALPGIGPYSAGAIASIVFGSPVPIVDANVARVLLRVEGVSASPKDAKVQRWLWARAESLVKRAEQPELLNEGLMELGAVVCTPRSPSCSACPIAGSCRAKRAGRVHEIPLAAPSGRKRTLHQAAVVVRDSGGRFLLERRPPGGLWASHWQAVALERPDRPPTAAEIGAALGVTGLRRIGAQTRITSAARVEIAVYAGRSRRPRRGEWVDAARLANLPVAGPHRPLLGLAHPSEPAPRRHRSSRSA